jgi:hypothetical protein
MDVMGPPAPAIGRLAPPGTIGTDGIAGAFCEPATGSVAAEFADCGKNGAPAPLAPLALLAP